MREKWRESRLETLLADMDAAVAEMEAMYRRDPAGWSRPAGKWTAGQHADHLAKTFEMTATSFEVAAAAHAAGALPRLPWRDPIEAWFIRWITSEGFPRGGRAPASVKPDAAIEPGVTLARVRAGADRHRALGLALDTEGRERVWIRNPFVPFRWHYTLPEMVRVHATHTRHHTLIASEAMAAARG